MAHLVLAQVVLINKSLTLKDINEFDLSFPLEGEKGKGNFLKNFCDPSFP